MLFCYCACTAIVYYRNGKQSAGLQRWVQLPRWCFSVLVASMAVASMVVMLLAIALLFIMVYASLLKICGWANKCHSKVKHCLRNGYIASVARLISTMFCYYLMWLLFGKEYSSDNAGPSSKDDRREILDEKHDEDNIAASLKRKHCAIIRSSDDERSGSCSETPEVVLNPMPKKHTWVVNVGLKNNAQFSGNKLANMIMKLEKKIKYFPEAITCFDQWICLRETNCDQEAGTARLPNGRIRCAIQISPLKKPLTSEWYREEWGWDTVKNSSNVNPWAGYEITKVRIFRYSVIAQQTNEGRPRKLKTDMEFAEETPQLMLAIKTGIDATPSMNGKVPRHTTYLRTTEREKKRASRIAKREIVKHYQGSDKEGNINYICCQSKCCVEGFGCSLLNAGEARCSYDIFQWIRGKYHQMSRLQQRAFIANRLINRCATSLANTKKFYFEKVEILQGYMHNCHLPSMPAIGV